jgi:hypothetical protein
MGSFLLKSPLVLLKSVQDAPWTALHSLQKHLDDTPDRC